MIELENVSVKIGSASLLSQVSLRFQPAKISVILGQNGAGKTTLLRCLSGWQTPSSGEIIWQGQPLKTYSLSQLAQQRAVLEQQQAQPFAMSVQALVELGFNRDNNAFNPRHAQAAQGVAQLCDIEALWSRNVQTLSGGELQRVHLARVLAQIWCDTPKKSEQSLDFTGKWLLLDEWSNAMDMEHQQQWVQLLQQWAQAGLGIIMIVHDLVLAQAVAQEVVLLKEGRVFAQGPANEVFKAPILEQGLNVSVRGVQSERGEVFLPKF